MRVLGGYGVLIMEEALLYNCIINQEWLYVRTRIAGVGEDCRILKFQKATAEPHCQLHFRSCNEILHRNPTTAPKFCILPAELLKGHSLLFGYLDRQGLQRRQLMISTKAGFKLAPPTKKPSISP